MEINIEEGQSAYLEFRKAFNKLNFDYVWHMEMQRIENEHYWIMGSMIQNLKQILEDDDVPNPLDEAK